MRKLVLASSNRGKLREFGRLLQPLELALNAQAELGIESAPETGTTFVENALLKARHAARCSAMPAIADDSGIAVDALDGAPGVYSARYAGVGASDEQNVAKLLDALSDVPEARRTARFECVIVFIRSADDAHPIIAHGCWKGRVLSAPRGDGGFGYDPVFMPDGETCSAAELSSERKNELSHRASATRELLHALRTADF